MAKKKKTAPETPVNALESAMIKTRGCTVNLSINIGAKKLTAVIEDRESGQIFDASADLEVRQ